MPIILVKYHHRPFYFIGNQWHQGGRSMCCEMADGIFDKSEQNRKVSIQRCLKFDEVGICQMIAYIKDRKTQHCYFKYIHILQFFIPLSMDPHQDLDNRLFPNHSFIPYDGTTLRKDIIFEYSDMPSEQIQANIPYNSQTRELDLGLVLHNHLIEMVPNGYKYQVFYYSNEFEYFVYGGIYPFEELLLLGQQYAYDEYLFVKINRIHPPIVPHQFQISKKKRKHDRTVKQMLEKVSQWRKIQQKNGVTFEEAAKIVEIPKKTLDDYFWHIKQGHTYNFDFEANLDNKVGALRKFVKQHHKRDQGENEIKILNSFMKEDQEQELEVKEDQYQQQQQYQSGEE